jgi:PAS domain S-box-containing protein
VLNIFEDPEGIIWIGTIGGGLDRFNRDTQTFTRYTDKNGLPDNTVYGILAGPDGTLWLSTNKGISHFDPRSETFRNYDISDGLQGNQFTIAHFQSIDGEMFFGGTQGLNAFFPDQVVDNPVPPPIVVTAFKKFNQTVQTDLAPNTALRLSYRDSFVSFEFAALDFNAPEKNQYAYKLDGFDKEWVQAGTRRYASYTNLPGGTYVFRVKGSNSDGVWNEAGVAIPITVTPPFWQTWWFYGSVVIVLGALITGGFRWRVNAIREQNIHLETEVSKRTFELQETNQQLEKEVEQRKRAEAELAKHAAEELEQSEARFHTIFENISIGIALISLDSQTLAVNPAILRMTGYEEAEILGMPGLELSHPNDRLLAMEPMRELVEGERDDFQIESRFVRKNGQVYWVKQSISTVPGADGKPAYIVVMVEDIDAQKHILLNLQESEARFRAMFDNTSVGIALTGLDRTIIQVNEAAARITGYPLEELKKINPVDLAVPEDRELSQDVLQELVTGKRESMTVERRYQRKNGEIFWGRVTYSLVREPDGQPLYLIGLIEDINEQKLAAEKMAAQEAEYLQRLEQRVQERTRELSDANLRLVSEIEQRLKAEEALATKAVEEAITAERTRLAHDLHDAVTQTLFSASLIAEVLPEIWDMDQVEARKATEELRQLTRGALAEMRTLLLELRPGSLTQARFPDLLKQLSEAVIGRARLPVHLDLSGDYEMPAQVKVVFYRIAQESLNNIVKYARATQVEIQLRRECCDVHLEIRDDGIGFDPSLVKPTSLGMHIMRERAEAIHAKIKVTSQPGKGTTISLDWNEDEVNPIPKIQTRGES